MKITMLPSPEFKFDVASALSQGRRDYQEDAVISDFAVGSNFGFAVLADGMGGHACGDIASKIVLTEVFSELKLQGSDLSRPEHTWPDILLDAVMSANECIDEHVATNPAARGMGSTLVAPVVVRDHLYWISVGDSPLYLFRNGALRQLNEDHSMAPQIDLMLQKGLINEEMALNHPDRNCLTSVLIGSQIAQIDCPIEPVKLLFGDVLVMASDGLQFLTNIQIETILADNCDLASSQIADALLDALETLGDPDQDNISFTIVRVSGSQTGEKSSSLAHLAHARTATLPRLVKTTNEIADVARGLVSQTTNRLRKKSNSGGGAM
jgi:serine/threonine protein phosphatase PrpC